MGTLVVTFTISDEQEAYLGEWMQKVSRSFALVVPFVEAPLTHYLATAYLLCRVADNIEDCAQPVAWKRSRFAEMEALLDDPDGAAKTLALWDQLDWPGLTDDEQAIMQAQYGAPLWAIYANIPHPSRMNIRQWVREMAEGMAGLEDAERRPYFAERNGVQVLRDQVDYDAYCYIVAGTVGRMSTELVIEHYGVDADAAERLRATAEACGRGLQKTNIIKDFAKDLRRGVCYLPDRWLRESRYAPLSLQGAPGAWTRQVIGNVLDELRASTEYVLALPYHAEGYRMASLLCLLPAYETMLVAAELGPDLFTARHQVKISRETMAHCLEQGRGLLHDNDGIAAHSRDMEARIRAAW